MCWTKVCWPEISSYRRVFFNLSRSVTENSEPTHFCTPRPSTPFPTPTSVQLLHPSACLPASYWRLTARTHQNLEAFDSWTNRVCSWSDDGSLISQTPVHSGEWAAAGQTRWCEKPLTLQAPTSNEPRVFDVPVTLLAFLKEPRQN